MFVILNRNNYLNNQLKTRELRNLKNDTEEVITININRTLPFEYISGYMNSFLIFLQKKALFIYSDYDTSLANINKNTNKIDVQIFWMDWRLYMEKMTPLQTMNWLKSHIINLGSEIPILINNWPILFEIDERLYSANVSKRKWIYEFNYLLECIKEDFINIEIIDLNLFAALSGEVSYDIRNDQLSNFPLSNQLSMQVARHIALNLLPSFITSKLKAIILDLDNTLYKGILGEDGIEKLELSENHLKLQCILKRLKENGILLAICSKNNIQDVFEMFERRKDYPLQLNDFTFIEANWNNKVDNILLLAEKFNFDVSAMLFIDDNLAEISHVEKKMPTIHTILADNSGQETIYRLLNYPFLYSRRNDLSVLVRQKDILSNEKRRMLAKSSINEQSYLETLKMKISVYENENDHISRIFELGKKTNQFNLALNRYTEEELRKISSSSNYKFYSVKLSDILNDSGIIGTFIFKFESEILIIEEVLFSCRALGRKVEDATLRLILKKLKSIGDFDVIFKSIKGPRNEPALNWLNSINKSRKINEIINLLDDKLKYYPAEVNWSNEGKN